MFILRSLFAVTSFLTIFTEAAQLKDLPPPPKPGIVRRDDLADDLSVMDLQSTETFIWGGGSGSALGNLTVYMPNEQENILSMERFRGMLKSVDCTNTSMDLTFKNDQTFEYAKRTWDWVNGADNHTFVMVAGTGDCGWNNHRQPFTVFELSYDEQANAANLIVNASDWQTAIHSYTLDVGQLYSVSPDSAEYTDIPMDLSKRGDHDKDITVDFNHQFPINSTTLSAGAFGISLSCGNCGTFGEFIFSFHLETTLLIPTDVSMGLQPRGVSMEIDPKISLSGNIGPSKTFQKALLTIPIEGVSIPGGILDLGPEVVFNAGVSVGPLQGSAGISGGVNLAIPDTASASLDLLDPNFKHSNWDPVITTRDIVLDARLSGGVSAFINAEIELAAKALGHGYDIGLTLGPFIRGKLEAVASTGTACKGDAEARHFAVDFNPTYGVELNAVLEDADGDPLLKANIAAWVHQLPVICFPFGDPGSIIDNTTISGDAPSPSVVPDQILTGDAATAAAAQPPSETMMVPDDQ